MNTTVERKLFAASNSYNGFYSLFDRVFNYNNYEKIFIVKGGPGTGKSTLMKRVLGYAENLNACVTKIYCSSDPESLDGIILEKNNKKAALLDGTSPHTFDPCVPGAKEVIINTLDSLDIKKITKETEMLCENHQKKKNAYSRAYAYLKSAGIIDSKIKDLYSEYNIYNLAENKFLDIYNQLSSNNSKGNFDLYFTSCFGKRGYESYCVLPKNKKCIVVNSSRFDCQSTLQSLHEKLKDMKIKHTVFLSPLDPSMIESVETDMEYITVNNTDLLSYENHFDSIAKGLLQSLEETKSKYLEISSKYFADASKFHFEMENIYSANMNFTSNEKLIDFINESITQIL